MNDESEALRERVQYALDLPTTDHEMFNPQRTADILNQARALSSLDIALIADASGLPVWWIITGELEEPSAREVKRYVDGEWRELDPPIVDITINTRKPGKWRFVDLETGDVWRWSGAHGTFKRADEEFPREWVRGE